MKTGEKWSKKKMRRVRDEGQKEGDDGGVSGVAHKERRQMN